jgi:chemotaxis protein CheX
MKPPIWITMRDAISNVLETMFFLVPGIEETQSAEVFDKKPLVLESSITMVSEADNLRMLFRVTKDFVSLITANFLGVESEEVTEEEMEDTLKELANMVGGDCLARLPANSWKLGIPKIDQPKANPDDYSASNMCTLLLYLDEEPMALVLLYAD